MASIIMFACLLGVAAAHISVEAPVAPVSIPNYKLQHWDPLHGANYFDYYAPEPTPAPEPIPESGYIIAPVPKYIPVSYKQAYSAPATTHDAPKYIPVRYTVPVPYRTKASYSVPTAPHFTLAAAHIIATVPYPTSVPAVIPQSFPHGASAYSTLNNEVILGTLASGSKSIKVGSYTA